MELKDILRTLPPQDQGLTIEYGGERFPMPYQTFSYGGEEIKGLRENKVRLRMFEKIFQDYHVPRESLIDIGCNMGIVLAHFQKTFESVVGVECDPIYQRIVSEIAPSASILPFDLNVVSLARFFSGRKLSAVLCLSMIENIHDKEAFVHDLYDITDRICIVEGHSETIYPKQLHYEYEALLRKQPWKVARWPELTDAGLNAPAHSVGRPVWVMIK